jgi:hypothetical protein
MIRSLCVITPLAFVLIGCSAAEPVTFGSTDEVVEALTEAGFTCADPEISPQATDETFSVIDCGRFAVDLIPDMSAWEAELIRDCGSLDSPDQREVLSEITVVSGPGWLIRSRDYGEVQQWQMGAEPGDFAAAFGGSEESLGQVCERLGGWD